MNSPVINKQSTLSITPPFVNSSPNLSVFKALFSAVKKIEPKGAIIATKQVIMNRCI